MLKTSATVRRVKFWWHLTLAYIRRYQLRIFIILSILVFSFYFFYSLAPNILRSNIVTVGFIGSYKIEDLPTETLSLVTQPLIKDDQSGKSVPDLASNWTVSEDGKKYVVFLKDNIAWHDGSPVEAKDISLAIKGVDVRAVNNKTIEFTLPNPISSFPLVLDTPVFKSNSFYGTGNFRIVDITQTEQVVKKIVLHAKNEDLPTVEIRFYPNEDQAISALKIGEIKVLTSVNINKMENWQNLNIAKAADKDEIVTVFLNNENGILASKETRQALWHAIRKEGFDGEPAISPVASKSWAYNDAVKKYDYNIARSKELLSTAEVKNAKITLSYATDLKLLAEKIKADWEAVGVMTELKEERGIPKDFQAYLAINKLPKDPDQYALWHSTQTNTNITHYKNVKIDKLLEDARAAKSDEDRKPLYLDFQRFLVEDAPAIFLYHPNKYRATYKNVQPLVDKLPTL